MPPKKVETDSLWARSRTDKRVSFSYTKDVREVKEDWWNINELQRSREVCIESNEVSVQVKKKKPEAVQMSNYLGRYKY